MNRLTFEIDSASLSRAADRSAFSSTERCETCELSLPCPSTALLELVLAFSCSHERTNQLQRVLRLNPPLLLLALHRYRDFNQAAAESPNQLIDWCEQNLLSLLLQDELQAVALNPTAPAKTRQLLKQFLNARSNPSCLSVLHKWVKLLRPKNHQQTCSKDFRKHWLKHILAKSFRLDGFHVPRLRKKSVLDATLLQWTQPDVLSTTIKPLIELATKTCRTQAEYQHQLETEKLAAMKQLAYGASHEINNPLANIATRAQTMLGAETHPEKRNKLATIYQQAMRAHEMISDMMLFAHPPATCVTTVSLRQVMRRFIGQLEDCKPQKEEAIETNVFIGPHFDHIAVDVTQFLVVLQMLVRNSKEAIRATKNAVGEIEIRAELVDRTAPGLPRRLQLGPVTRFLQVSVEDNGIGVDAQVRRHLFDPFFSGREAGRGLGFGLSKTWRIVEQHGGEIVLDEAHPANQGARFVFWLPQPG